MSQIANNNSVQFGKVAVLMGGLSAERDISLLTGKAVLTALLEKGIDAHAIDAGEDVIEQIMKGHYDRVFIALHGRGGEDGQIQGALDTLGLPYTGSKVLGSALSMDKLRCKQLWQSLGLATPAWKMLASNDDLHSVDELVLPVMIKPAHEGSSIGMSKVNNTDDLEAAWNDAIKYDDSVLAEEFISGDEYTVAILAGDALPVIKLETDNDFYDFDAKYQSENTRYLCPCGLSEQDEKQLQALAVKAFNAAGASGWGRVDLMRDGQGQSWLIEVNTVPGMTSHSLVPMAAKAAGMSFADLVSNILETSIEAVAV
ncbi:MAG: D-alanine--D-alanine ligase [Sulfuriflexus sp.]|nr:D-alanine--D-alanine ligase [Sulfuriflexus sp.]